VEPALNLVGARPKASIADRAEAVSRNAENIGVGAKLGALGIIWPARDLLRAA
jgi:hypothetical protein